MAVLSLKYTPAVVAAMQQLAAAYFAMGKRHDADYWYNRSRFELGVLLGDYK